MMFTALEGPGIGHQEQPQADPVSSLCLELDLIKCPPPVPCFILVCLSFHHGCLRPTLAVLRTEALFWMLGAACGLVRLFSGPQAVAWYCSLRSGTEVGRELGFHSPRDLRRESWRRAVGRFSPRPSSWECG